MLTESWEIAGEVGKRFLRVVRVEMGAHGSDVGVRGKSQVHTDKRV